MASWWLEQRRDLLKRGLVPIGKHKGQYISVLKNDPQYVKWLISQQWVKHQLPEMYQFLLSDEVEFVYVEVRYRPWDIKNPVPFGKYKGKMITDLEKDERYVERLIRQRWFREVHREAHEYLIRENINLWVW